MGDQINLIVTPPRAVNVIVDPPASINVIVDTSPPGAPGSGPVASSYLHLQPTPALVWTIVHNLAMYPNVTTAQDAGGWETIEGDVEYLDANTVTVTFAYLTAGRAFLS